MLRNITIEEHEDTADIIKFLTDDIGINECWISEAKAAQSLKWKDYKEAVKYLIEAQCYDTAHKVCVWFGNF